MKVWLLDFVLLARPQKVFRDEGSDDLLYMIRLPGVSRFKVSLGRGRTTVLSSAYLCEGSVEDAYPGPPGH